MLTNKKISLFIFIICFGLLNVSCDNQLTTSSLLATSAQSSISKNPYIIYTGKNTEMKLMWQLTKTYKCKVEWGIGGTYSLGSATTTENSGVVDQHLHSYTIKNLSPGTKYDYRITISDVQRTGSFFTAPASDAANLKFVAYGDTRSNPDLHNDLAATVLATYAMDEQYKTMILAMGDLLTDGNLEMYWTSEFFNTSLSNVQAVLAGVPFISARGNHEGLGIYFKKYFPYPYVSGTYWSFDYGPLHVVILDQYTDYKTGSAQYKWLVKDLSSSAKKWKFIVLHEPGWSAYSTNTLEGHPNNKNVQTYVQPLCVTYGVSVVLAAHNHYYARALVNGVYHITSAGGGAPLYDPVPNSENVQVINKTRHFCKIEISGSQLVFKAVDPDENEIDSFTIVK
jgi:hypothetical protein